jgi:uncharacterized integral membrane protein
MEVLSATIIELFNIVMGICIIIISLYASKKFNIHLFKRGWLIIALSGAVMVLGSIFRSYYSFTNQYLEWAWLGRIFILIHLLFLLIGIYLLALTAVKMWGD